MMRATFFKAKETKIGYLRQNTGLASDRSIWNELMSVFAGMLEMEEEIRRLEARMSEPDVLADEKKNGGHDAALRRAVRRVPRQGRL